MNLKNRKNNSRGFTLIELLIVLSILTILVSITVSSFRSVGGSEALDTSVMTVMSILNEAHSLAISSKDASNYGVRIISNKLVSFKNAYGTENKEIIISNLVTLSTSIGIGNEVVFNNVTGNTNANGIITVTVSNNPIKNSSIRIYSTGVVEKI